MRKPRKKRIIGVFGEDGLLQAHTDALRAAGHEVCAAHNLAELKRHLDQGKCDLVVIGPTIPPQEKLRIADFSRRHTSTCEIVEIYSDSPQLDLATLHLRSDTVMERLVESIAAILSGTFLAQAASKVS